MQMRKRNDGRKLLMNAIKIFILLTPQIYNFIKGFIFLIEMTTLYYASADEVCFKH